MLTEGVSYSWNFCPNFCAMAADKGSTVLDPSITILCAEADPDSLPPVPPVVGAYVEQPRTPSIAVIKAARRTVIEQLTLVFSLDRRGQHEPPLYVRKTTGSALQEC